MAANFGSYNFQRNNGYSVMTCTLRVDASIPGWQRTVRNVLSSIHGVYNSKMDPNGLVEVSGAVHPHLLLERIRRAGRHAEIVSLRYGECSRYLYTPGHGGGGHDYRGDHVLNPHYRYGRHGGRYGDGFGGGMDYATCNDTSYGGYWDHPRRPSHNRPFAGLAESLRASSCPRWFGL